MVKRLLFSLALLALFFSFSEAQTYVQIGNGTESSSMPYTVWKYSWAKALYQAEDLDGEKTITHIALESEGSYDMSNQTVYFKTTSDSELSDSYEEPTTENGYTKVYEGNYSVSEGWNEIELNSPFEYNGTDNIVIYWMNEHGSEVYANFLATDAEEENLIKVKGGNNSVPEEDGTSAYPDALPNIQFFYESDEPANPTNPQPENTRIKVDVETSLTFDLGENTTHYNLYLGKNEDNLEKVVDMQSVDAPETVTHSIDTLLKGDTEYYWQVAAINDASGDETSSPVWSFTTEELIVNYPWETGFEEVWEGIGGEILSSIINTNYPDSTHWEWTDLSWSLETDSNQVAGNVNSGHFGIHCSGSNEGEKFVRTPRFNLPENMRASFWWRNGPRGEEKSNSDTTFFQISDDGGGSWYTLDTLAPGNTMEDFENTIVDLSDYSGDNIYMRWVYKVTQTSTNYILLDDVKVEENPTGALIELSEEEINYPDLCRGGKFDYEIVIYNNGVEDLNISGVDAIGDFESEYSGTIMPGEQDTAIVSFNPESAGEHTGNVSFQTTASGEAQIELTGNSYEPVTEFFEDFDDTEEMPDGWYHIDSPDGYTSGGGVDIVSFSGDAYSDPNAAKILMANDTVSPLILVSKGVAGFDQNQLTFYAKKADEFYDVDLQIGVMSNPYDASTFVPKKTIPLDHEFRADTVTFKPTTSEPYIAFKHNGNPNGQDDWTSIRIDNISWESGESTEPNAANVIYPADDSTDINIMKQVELDWNAGSSNTEGFVVYFGKDDSEFEIVNQDTVFSPNSTYTIEEKLEYNTTYYWKVVPFNDVGEAEDVQTWSFSTMEDPVVENYPWEENFDEYDNTDGYNLPSGWSGQDLNEDHITWDLWTDNHESGVNYSYSEPNAMHIAFGYHPKDDYLYTPPLNLESGKEYELSFWWVTPVDEVTGQTYKERMKIFLGNDNIDSAMTTELFNDSIEVAEYEKVELTFSPEQDGRHFLGFYAWSDGMQYLLLLDDIKVSVSNTAPEFTSEPETDAVIEEEYSYSIVTNDAEGDDVEILGETIPEWLSLTDNKDGTAELTGTPGETGEYEVVIVAGDENLTNSQEFTIAVEEDATSIFETADNNLSVSPNPSNGTIHVNVGDYQQYKNNQIKVLDITGKVLERNRVEGVETKIDLSDLDSGVYFIQVGSAKNRVTEKIILR